MMQSMGAIPVAGNTTVEAPAVHHALGVSKKHDAGLGIHSQTLDFGR